MNFKVNEGETVAIIGKSGSGKTTLSKIITGMYAPSSGVIQYGFSREINTNNSIFSIIEQGIVQYYFKLYETISLKTEIYHSEKIKILGILNRLQFNKTQDLDVQLGPEFGGQDLSGGEWQSLSIARCIYKSAKIYVLDEPTSAIDPIKENQILSNFLELSKNKTSIIITHRMSFCKHVDKIILIDSRRIVSVGSHII